MEGFLIFVRSRLTGNEPPIPGSIQAETKNLKAGEPIPIQRQWCADYVISKTPFCPWTHGACEGLAAPFQPAAHSGLGDSAVGRDRSAC